jgi:hypothetical protein
MSKQARDVDSSTKPVQSKLARASDSSRSGMNTLPSRIAITLNGAARKKT